MKTRGASQSMGGWNGVQGGFGWRKECADQPAWASRNFGLAARRWTELTNKPVDLSPRKAIAHISQRLNVQFCEVNLSGMKLLLAVDNMQVACQTMGFWHVPVSAPYVKVVEHIRWMLHAAQTTTNIRLGRATRALWSIVEESITILRTVWLTMQRMLDLWKSFAV
jgi:hypothetical protein